MASAASLFLTAPLCLAISAGCSATIGDPLVGADEPSGGGAPSGAQHGTAVLASCQGVSPPQDPMRRLTNFEYERTLTDLFPGYDIGTPGQEIPGDVIGREYFFDNLATSQGLSTAHVDAYGRVSARIAELTTADAKFTGCEPAGGTDSCFQAFLKPFAGRAFRRPATAGELERITATYAKAKASLGFGPGVQAAIERILQSPQFLYRLESFSLDSGGARTNLSSYELSSRLSFLMWGTLPDAELNSAAADGSLDEPRILTRQAERMFDDPRAKASLGHLADQWFNLPSVENQNKDMTMFPNFSSEIAKLMMTESRTFLEKIMFAVPADVDRGVKALLSASFTFANAKLAGYYGLPPGLSGEAFPRVSLDPKRAAGILSQGAFTSLRATDKTTHPIKRGVFIRTRLLCDPLPAPPANIPPAPKFTGNETGRELLAKHRDSAACNTCHELIDPVGLGLESYDAAGVFRERDFDGLAVDASGEIVNGGDAAGRFQGAAELGQKLASSAKVRACVATQFFRFAFGRESTEGDACTIDLLTKALSDDGGGFRRLLLDLVASDAFRYRTN